MSDGSASSGVVGEVLQLLDQGQSWLSDPEADAANVVHECRKNNKRILAKLQLLESHLPKARLRRVRKRVELSSRTLASARMGAATMQRLSKLLGSEFDSPEYRPLTTHLRGLATLEHVDVRDQAREALRRAAELLQGATRTGDIGEPSADVRVPLQQSKRNLLERWRRVKRRPSPRRLHLLRKQLKAYLVQRRTAASPLRESTATEVERLTEQLGKLNDFRDLRALVERDGDALGLARKHQKKLSKRIEKARRKTSKRALKRAARLFDGAESDTFGEPERPPTKESPEDETSTNTERQA